MSCPCPSDVWETETGWLSLSRQSENVYSCSFQFSVAHFFCYKLPSFTPSKSHYSHHYCTWRDIPLCPCLSSPCPDDEVVVLWPWVSCMCPSKWWETETPWYKFSLSTAYISHYMWPTVRYSCCYSTYNDIPLCSSLCTDGVVVLWPWVSCPCPSDVWETETGWLSLSRQSENVYSCSFQFSVAHFFCYKLPSFTPSKSHYSHHYCTWRDIPLCPCLSSPCPDDEVVEWPWVSCPCPSDLCDTETP